MSKDNGTISTIDAAAAIAEDRQRREQEATREIEAILQKHDCRLDASVLLRVGQVVPQIQITAND